MSDAKQLPDNIDALEKTEQFKALDEQYTVKVLEQKLRTAKVAFLSADNKPDLIWRWLDSQGLLKDDNTADNKNDVQQDAGSADDDTSGNPDAVSSNTNADGSDDSDSHTHEPTKPVTQTDKGDSDATNSDREEDTQSSATGHVVNGDDSTSQTQDADTTTQADDSPSVDDLKYIEVKSTADFNMLEPATSTLVVAGKTTKIYLDARTSKEQVLRNIEQYNHTRGKKLTVTN